MARFWAIRYASPKPHHSRRGLTLVLDLTDRYLGSSMNLKRSLIYSALLSIASWTICVLALAIWVFLMPHPPGFAPEMGPAGTFMVVVVVGSIPFLVAAFFVFSFILDSRIEKKQHIG